MAKIAPISPESPAPTPEAPESPAGGEDKNLANVAAKLREEAQKQGGMNAMGLSMMQTAATFDCADLILGRLDTLIAILGEKTCCQAEPAGETPVATEIIDVEYPAENPT